MCANFNAMTRELGHMETLRSDFVTSVSHEFKTPLAAIEGCATILQNPDLNDFEVREYSRKISESTRQLAKLSSNVLMISNWKTGKSYIDDRFRLDEQIRQAILYLSLCGKQKQQYEHRSRYEIFTDRGAADADLAEPHRQRN
jgi:K+-sensing histidine kinase KdpD